MVFIFFKKKSLNVKLTVSSSGQKTYMYRTYRVLACWISASRALIDSLKHDWLGCFCHICCFLWIPWKKKIMEQREKERQKALPLGEWLCFVERILEEEIIDWRLLKRDKLIKGERERERDRRLLSVQTNNLSHFKKRKGYLLSYTYVYLCFP